MKFQILILTQQSRSKMLDQLLSVLTPQCEGREAVISVRNSDPSLSLGANREIMRREASGEYIAFVDDDDLVSADYVSKILPLLDGSVDIVGFRLQQYADGRAMKPTCNRLSYGKWFEDAAGYYRDISHVCPMRRELALRVPMEGDFGEDRRWADAMRPLVKTDHFIDEVIYFYLWRKHKHDSVAWNEPYRMEMLQALRPVAV